MDQHKDLTMESLCILRDTAHYYALKYRWDPTIGKIHNDYLEAIKAVIEADKKASRYV